MELDQAFVAIGAAVLGAGIALIGSVYAARVSRRSILDGLDSQRQMAEEAWRREQDVAHRRWVRDQIDLRVGEVLVAINRFSRAVDGRAFDGAWVEYANANDRLARIRAGDDVEECQRRLNGLMRGQHAWRISQPDLEGGEALSEWWDRFDPIWTAMGALNHAALQALERAAPR